MPIEVTGHLSPEEASAMGRFLVEMAVLERAVDRALLDQYSNNDTRDLFITHFLGRKTLGPKCDALIAVALNADENLGPATVDELGRQIRELVRVRNAVAHESPTVEYQVEHEQALWGNDYMGYEHGEIRSVARYGSIDMDAADLLAMADLAQHVRGVICTHLHRPLADDTNDDTIVQ